MADAQKTLIDALESAQKSYEKAIDAINKSTAKKLAELQDKLKEIAAEMAAISAASAALALANAPTTAKAGDIIPAVGYDPARAGMTANPYANGSSLTVNNNITTTTVDPTVLSTAVVSAVKYGNAVMIGNRSAVTIL